jgi:hypothetical protein
MSREGERLGPLGMANPVNEAAEQREAALQRGIEAFHELYKISDGRSRAQAVAVEFFLRSVGRDAARPLDEVIVILYKKLALPGVSEEFRALVSKTASECATVFGHGGDRIVLPPMTPESLEDDEDPATASSEVTPPSGVAFITAQQLGSTGDKMSLDSIGISYGPSENVRALNAEAQQERRNAARIQKRKHFERVFLTSRSLARRFVGRAVPEGTNAVQLAERVEDTSRTLGDFEAELYELFGFSATCIRNTPTEAFFIEYFAASERAGEDANEFDHKVNEYIAVRARIRELLSREAEVLHAAVRVSPEQIFGVKDNATQEEVEQRYLLRLQVLDPDIEEDLASIAMLHAARERVLARFANTNSSVPPMTRRLREETEGLFTRTLRAPGKLLRTLFGIAAFGAATGIAVHQFAENDSDEPKIVDVAPEGGEITDLSGFETPTVPIEQIVVPEQVPKKAPSSNEVTLERGDSVWKIVIGMLRERGLSTSHAQVQYFTHQALIDNGWTALSALEKKPGEKLDVTNIAHMMDAVAGGGDVVAAMEPVSQEASDSEYAAPLIGASAEADDYLGLRGFGIGASEDWERGFIAGTHQPEAIPVATKPYAELPTADHAEHVMVKGESVYKLVHQMLRSRGLNWTTERINFLTQLVVDKNVDRFREMVADGRMRRMDDVWIPAGAMLDFSDAVAVVDDMERAKKAGKKAKTVKELAKDRGYKYPIMMKFPKE